MARRFFLVALSSIVAACGGGGGGDGGGGNGNVGGNPAGGASPFALTEPMALEAGSYVLGALEEAMLGASAAAVTALDLSLQGSIPPVQCGGTPLTREYDDRDASGTVTVGDVIHFFHAECFGLARDYSLTLATFDISGGTIEGRVEMDTSLDPPGLRVAGAFTLSLTFDAGTTRWGISNAALTVTSHGTPQAVRMTTSEFFVTPTSYTLTMAGGNVDSTALGGSYAFETPTPFTGAMRRLPSAGTLVLSTASRSRVSISAPAAPLLGEATVDYAVAAPGAGYAPTLQGFWTALLRGNLFGWRPNTAPVLSNVTINPAEPGPGQPLRVWYDASDPDTGDSLTIEIAWRRNGQPVGTNSPLLEIATARNDVIDVTVSVSDGRVETPTRDTASVTIGNRPPVLTSLSITPQSPDTTADLVAVADVSDPDGDPLQATYVWYRNGTELTGHTTAVLPASETTRGDAFLLTATFADDALSAMGSATAAIVDAPPRVTVAAPPVSAAYGMPANLAATVSDDDGDPVDQLRFEIAHGPAGMTVDPVTGTVAWTPTGPMLDRVLDVNWGITVGFLGARAATGTIRVEDPARDYPWLRTGIQIPLLSSLRVGDFDDDGDTEMLLLGLRWLLEIEADGAGGYRQSWAYPFVFDADDNYSSFGALRTVTTGDVDGDDLHEIFVTTDSGLVKLDGGERRVVASVQIGPNERCTDIEYGDIDGDGAAEVVCATLTASYSGRLIVYRASDLSVHSVLPEGAGTRLALGNVDADAPLEIVTSGGHVIDGASGTVQWHYTPGFTAVSTGDIDASGPDEIVAWVNFGELAAFRAGNETPLFAVPSQRPDTLLVADIGGDARAEILTGDNQWGNVTAYRYDADAGTATVVFQIDSQDHGVSAFGVGDVDGDSAPEIVWGTGLSSSGADRLIVAGLNPGIEVEWSSPIQLDGPFVGGAPAGSPADAKAPLFVTATTESGYSGSRIVRLDPADGAIDTSPQFDTATGSRFSTLTIGDYDADGTDEALLASDGPYNATPTVYDFYSDVVEWTPAQLQSVVQLASANVYGDARDELVWLDRDGVVSVLDVATQQLIWQSDASPHGRTLKLADLDGDGYAEIIAANLFAIVMLERSPTSQPFQIGALFSSELHVVDIAAGDTDGDGAVEIFALLDSPNATEPHRVVQFDSRLRQGRWFWLPWDAQSIAIEQSAFARKNLLVSRVEGELGAGRLVTIDARNGAVVSESPQLIGGILRNSVHYVTTGSGEARLSIGTEGGMYLTR